MRILIACGGTGGHINPGLAIAGIIKQHVPNAEFLFVGTPNGMEATLVPAAGYNMEYVQVAGFQRSLSPANLKRNIKAAGYLMSAGRNAKRIVKNFAPDLAIGTGGYASGPVIRAAQQLHIPTAIHEQNAYPGVTNKLLAKKADTVMMTFEAAKQYFPQGAATVLTGLPVRGNLTRHTKEQAMQKLGFGASMCILSFGGSQGAKCLNDLIPDLIKWEKESGLRFTHIHAYGKFGRDTVPEELRKRGLTDAVGTRVTEYIHDMDVCLAAADLVISRAGASTLSELEAVGRPSLLIPYPNAAENHQYHNAMVLGKAGAAIVVEQKDLKLDVLISNIRELYKNPEKRTALGQRAGALFPQDTDDRIWAAISPLLN